MSITFTKQFPTFMLSPRLYLREHTDADIKSFFEYYTEDVSKHILAPKPRNLDDAKAEIQYCKNLFYFKRGIYWSICDKDSDKMIGAIGLTIQATNKRGELHYDLAKPLWGQGITTKAIEVVVEYALKKLQLIRVEALTTADNSASHRVLLKNGFIHEGRLHAYKYYENNALDVEMFSITQAGLLNGNH